MVYIQSFNPVSKEQYYFKIPQSPYWLLYMTQMRGLLSFLIALYTQTLRTGKKMVRKTNIGLWLLTGDHHTLEIHSVSHESGG